MFGNISQVSSRLSNLSKSNIGSEELNNDNKFNNTTSDYDMIGF